MTPERKSAVILGGIAVTEGLVIVLNAAASPQRFLAFIGFAPGRLGAPAGWLLAAVVTALFVGVSVRLPAVRHSMFRASWLKALALLVAIAAGILEELVFRKLLMDWLAREGYGGVLQVVASGVAFGAAHGVWGLFGRSIRA